MLPKISFIYILCLSAFVSCNSTRETVANKGMQNLTTKFNILYNATELLSESETKIYNSSSDDYEQLLPVFKTPTEEAGLAEAKNLDSIIVKANFIINEKKQSDYVDDAYFLIGRANYYKANFFNAAEFFNYLAVTYPQEKSLHQLALAWKSRSLMSLGSLAEAQVAIDTALKNVAADKESASTIYATKAQLALLKDQEEEAIVMLENALKAGTTKLYKLRWGYLLAQLQEKNRKQAEAYQNYTAIVKSNAPFEMAFNANLNRIRIANTQTGNSDNRIGSLRSLLRDDKNSAFKDQIYYRIANEYMKVGDTTNAIKNYKVSIRLSTNNPLQKGQSYLQLADTYFKAAQYSQAKIYYDSTLLVLPKSFTGYSQIVLKSNNLQILSKSIETIKRETDLQRLALLSESERNDEIQQLIQQELQTNSEVSIAPNSSNEAIDYPLLASAGNDKFYFNNSNALTQGYSDFKKRWGNRGLDDNWRRGSKNSIETVITLNAADEISKGISSGPSAATEALKKSYLQNLPLTANQLNESNKKIINAYYDIANFYKDILKDNSEAISAYEDLLKKYPENEYKLAIYYNLYRLNLGFNAAESDKYKDILLKQFPDSRFAKVISDPLFSQKANEREIELNLRYNNIYELYTQRKYKEVAEAIDLADQQFGNNPLSAQFAYLKALAVGHTEKLDPFETALTQLVKNFPDDKLVTPLTKENLDFISKNRDEMSSRVVALVDFDTNQKRFVAEPDYQPAPVATIVAKPVVSNTKAPEATVKPSVVPSTTTEVTKVPEQPIVKNPVVAEIPAANAPATQLPLPEKAPEPAKPVYDMPESAEYYFVVNVKDPVVNLSSSRFGIGQFNRSNYSSGAIKHQLKGVNNENQLIFVSSFFSLKEVKEYEKNITPLMTGIMKISKDRYDTFVITKETFDKLSDRNTINTYFEFYKTER